MATSAEHAALPPDETAAPEDPELRWLRTVYRPGARQLTVRAVIAGMVIGAVMCLSNLYVVLKTGWSLGVTVTSCILAYAVFQLLTKLGIAREHFTTLENNAMGSVASAAGYMTGGGNMAAVPALLMLTGQRPQGVWMFLWFAVIAALGVFVAIPIKRQLINIEQLPFPSGLATAETLLSLHAHEESGGKDDGKAGRGTEKARILGWAGLTGVLVAFFRDAKTKWLPVNLPKGWEPPLAWGGATASQWSLSLDTSLILMGAGALMGFRTGWSLLGGAIASYGFLAPWLVTKGLVAKADYKLIVQFTLWPAAALLLCHGLLSFAFQWRSVAKSFAGLARLMKRGPKTEDPMEAVECPAWWFPAGFLVLGPVIIFLMMHLFGMPWWAGLMALPLSVAMGVVAARVTGETDVTPTKALGPVTQLVYGAALPGNLAANIMGANVTGGVGLHAADLLLDLKSGYMVGANPRQQLYAQFFGVIAGAAVVVPVFNLLIPEASVLGSPEFPAPAVQVWAGVSKALTTGVSSLPVEMHIATAIGAATGVVLAIADRFAPKKWLPWIPSASGLGISLVVPGANAIAMFLGATAAEIVRRRSKDLAERSVVPIASGFIAGESLMGILIKGLIVAGVLSK